MWRALRIGILLVVLLAVAQSAWIARSRTAEWREPLRVVIYPINGDRSAASDAYVRSLRLDAYQPVSAFLSREARGFNLALRNPVELYLAPPVEAMPPAAPRQANALEAVLWSLRLRFWAWRNDGYAGAKPHVRMFVLYFAPRDGMRLAHSVGLQKGLLGVVNAFASAQMENGNNIVIAHELLHTFGATDKYDVANNRPQFPDGYAEPHVHPLHPQTKAEIMAGRIPVSAAHVEVPEDFGQVVIGAKTAHEINWLR